MKGMTTAHAIANRDSLGDQRLEVLAHRTAIKKGQTMRGATLNERKAPQKGLMEHGSSNLRGGKTCGTPALTVTTQVAQRGGAEKGHAGREGKSVQIRKAGQIFERGGEREGAIRLKIESHR